MKKIFLITLSAIAVLCSVLYTSCKKIIHPAHPVPNNARILSYSKFSSSPFAYRDLTENFRFYYDGNQRLVQIIYSTNDSVSLATGAGDQSITFTYRNDSIYKVITAVHIPLVLERDTFQVNSYGFIKWAYTPGEIHNYDYYGKLIYLDKKVAYDSGTAISASHTYTSNNGDLLVGSYDGTLTVNFPDSGISFFVFPHDTALTAPYTVTWVDFGTTTASTIITKHTGVPFRSDVLTGYASGNPVAVVINDNWGVFAYDTLIWPGGIWRKEGFTVYGDLEDRPGDYLQIESFTKYGVNIYQNAHLLRQIYEENGPTTEVRYTIDADSKITETYVTKTDRLGNKFTTIYKFQYETF